MSRPKRQMHFGVFWVGTGNHLAGWRHEGAASSNSYWPAVVESAQIAERGKLDMFFIADSVGMDFDVSAVLPVAARADDAIRGAVRR